MLTDKTKIAFYGSACLCTNIVCSLIAAVCVTFLWTLLEGWLVGTWHFGDRFTSFRQFLICSLSFILFYLTGLVLFRQGIRKSTFKQKAAIHGLALFYVLGGFLIIVIAHCEMYEAYAYVESLRQFQNSTVLNFTATVKDRSLAQKTLFVDENASTIQLKQAIMNAKAYHVNHDTWLLEGTLLIALDNDNTLAFEWYVPEREPKIAVLKPQPHVYIVIDNDWLKHQL